MNIKEVQNFFCYTYSILTKIHGFNHGAYLTFPHENTNDKIHKTGMNKERIENNIDQINNSKKADEETLTAILYL